MGEKMEKEILELVIGCFGILHQKNKLFEECGELIQAIAKDDDLENISEEIADVEIMLEQMKIIYRNEDKVKKYRKLKLKKILEEITNNNN